MNSWLALKDYFLNLSIMKLGSKIILSLVLTLTLFASVGCNTVKGLGEDFEAMGESMQKAGE